LITNQSFAETLLDGLQKPEDYNGPEIEVILKESKCDNLREIVDSLLKDNVTGSKIGMFQKNEEEDGELSATVIERVNSLGYKVNEM